MQVELKQNRKWMGCKLTPRRVVPMGITFSKLVIGDTHWIEITIQWTALCLYLEQCYELWEMEVGCLRHPGASTIGSQLLAGLQIQGTHPISPHVEREKNRHPSH